MKKNTITLILACVFTSTLLNAQNVSFVGTKLKNVLLAHGATSAVNGVSPITGNGIGRIDTNNDGEISIAEATAYNKTIYINNQGIPNTTGLEAFTNIEKLYVSMNNNASLTTLDVSANTALKELFCHYSKLTSLNISGNSNLEILQCINNQLTSLDVSNNSNMKKILCANNSLTSLNTSSNTALTALSLSNNKLTSVNVSANTLLTELVLSGNKLTSIDVSANTALKKLSVNSNELTSIDISTNTVLDYLEISHNLFTSLAFATANTSLEVLSATNNLLTSIDVSNLTNLKQVYASGNKLVNVNVANGNNSAFGYVDFQNNPDLRCIQIDAGFTPSNSKWRKDAGVGYSSNCATTAPKIIYVRYNATGNNDGTSWANAYTNIHDAITNALREDQIWVAKGTYTPDASIRDASFTIYVRKLKIYGGFAGTETNLNNRDVTQIHTTNETVLSGDLNGNDVPITGNDLSLRADNSYHVVTIQNTTDVLLDGFTISGGAATATSGHKRAGGGIFADKVDNLTLHQCIIKDNIAIWAAGMSYTPNSEGRGNGATSNSNLIIDACQFSDNRVDVAAAGFYALLTDNLKVQMTNSVFNDNKVANGGYGAGAALLRNYDSSKTLEPVIVNNTFVNNVNGGNFSATSDYATLGISRNNDGIIANHVVANNIFWGNKDTQGNTTVAIGKVNDVATIDKVYNSIDEDDFSNFTAANKINTSSTNPNLTTTFALQTSSTAAINTGDNTKVPTGIISDILGNNRIHNTTVDMGAFEFGASLGIDNFNAITKVSIFPNPVSSVLTIVSSAANIKTIDIYNVLGKKVASTTQKQVEVSNLPSGMYILKVQSAEGKIATKKFIKQ